MNITKGMHSIHFETVIKTVQNGTCVPGLRIYVFCITGEEGG